MGVELVRFVFYLILIFVVGGTGHSAAQKHTYTGGLAPLFASRKRHAVPPPLDRLTKAISKK